MIRLALAGLVVLATMFLGPLSSSSAQPNGVGNGLVDWNGWLLSYGVDVNDDGLHLGDVTYDGTLMISRISLPVMSVYYEDNVCGPYADVIGGTVYDGVYTNEFTQGGEQWLELAIQDQIGAYVIYQSFYFSESGVMNSHIFSKALQCNTYHEHLPYWRVDFDIDGATNDEIVRLNQAGGYVVEGTEFDMAANAAVNHEWYVRDSVTGSTVQMSFDDGSFAVPGVVIPESEYIENNVYGRNYSSDPAQRFWNRPPSRSLPWNNGESISDVVLWYTGFMPHSPEEGPSLWHSTGMSMQLVPDPLNPGPTPTPTATPAGPTPTPTATAISTPTPTPIPTATAAATATPTTTPEPTPTPVPGGPTVLTSGESVTGLSGPQGSEQFFVISVPAGATELAVTLTGDGDADLYTRAGSAPTQTAWDCRPYIDGSSNETCTTAAPAAGDHFVMVRGWAPFDNVSLTATVATSPPGGGGVLANGVPVTGLSGVAGAQLAYTIDVPAGATNLLIEMTGSGDADLYLRQAGAPTLTNWDCRPYIDATSVESCSVAAPVAGTYHIMVRGYTAFSAVSLTGSYETGGSSNVLTPGVPVTDLAGAALSQQYFTIDVPAFAQELEVILSGGTGDADLYTLAGGNPTLANWDCRPYIDATSDEICLVPITEAGTHHIMVRGYAAFSGASLEANIIAE